MQWQAALTPSTTTENKTGQQLQAEKLADKLRAKMLEDMKDLKASVDVPVSKVAGQLDAVDPQFKKNLDDPTLVIPSSRKAAVMGMLRSA